MLVPLHSASEASDIYLRSCAATDRLYCRCDEQFRICGTEIDIP